MSDKYSERIVRAREYLSDLLGERNFRNDDAVDLANYDEWLDEWRAKDVCEYKWNAIEGRWECTCGYCLPHRVVFGKLCGNCGRPIKEVKDA